MAPRFPFVAVEVAAARADELAERLFELGATGVEQRDEQTHPDPERRLALEPATDGAREGWRTLAIDWRDEGEPGGPLPPRVDATSPSWGGQGGRGGRSELPALRDAAVVTLVASFASHAEAERAAQALVHDEPALAPELGEVVGDEWRERYKKAFAPFLLTPSLRIVPPWLPTPEPAVPTEQLLWLDPGRAFGTGLHPTTALVAQLLDDHAAELAGVELLDVGTGSGILALCALRFGAARAVAIDDDEDALTVALANAQRNGLAERVEVRATPLGDLGGVYPWVVANIELRVLRALAVELARHVAPHGRLVLSGLLAPQHVTLLEHLRAEVPRPFALVATVERESGDDRWVAMVLRADAAEAGR